MGFYLRILVISILIAILGLGPTPHAISTLMANAYQAAASGDYLNAANDLVEVHHYYPWRNDLTIKAARYAIQAGDAETRIRYLESPELAAALSADDKILLGDAYQQIGDTSKAEALWKEVAAQGESNQAHQRLIDLYLQQKDYHAAVGSMKELLTLNPSDSPRY